MNRQTRNLYIIYSMVILFGVYFLVTPDFMMSKPIFAYIVEIIAGTLGVLMGFTLEANAHIKEGEDRATRLLNDVKTELQFNVERMTGKGVLIKTTVWDSAVSSGLVQSLSEKQLERLSRIYFGLKGYEYEAIRSRDASIRLGGLSADDINYLPTSTLWHQLSENSMNREQNMKERIENLLKEDGFWN